MSFTKLSDYSYIALSGDVKTTVGIIAGARLIEYDTDSLWVFDGTAWREVNDVSLDSLTAIQAAVEALALESVSGGLEVISQSHKEIHEGHHFTYFHSDATATNINERTLIAFKTPNTSKRIHFLYQGSASAAAHFHIIRGPAEGAAGGTEVIPLNNDENSAIISTVKSARVGTVNRLATYVAADAGNITGGTIIRTELIGATGQGQMTIGGSTRAEGEIILKQDTVYAVAVENLDNNVNTHGIFIEWYEN